MSDPFTASSEPWSPEPSAPAFRERQVRANGLSFRVLEQGGGERLALCLHGFPECAHSWRHQLPLLAGLGYRAWAPDLRGYGGSDRPSERSEYALEKLLGDVSGLIAAAGASEVLLVGHDWGALIAWYYAMRDPGSLTRLAILNVPHPQCYADELGLRQLLKSWYGVMFQIPGLVERLLDRGTGDDAGQWAVRAMRESAVHPERFDDAAMRPFRENAAKPGAVAAMVAYYREAVAGGGFRRQSRLGLPSIRTPTLMLWGEQDLALTKRVSFGTARHVPDLVQRYLPDASHWLQQDQPELVNDMLGAWLEGRPVPHAAGATADLG